MERVVERLRKAAVVGEAVLLSYEEILRLLELIGAAKKQEPAALPR